MNAYASDCTTNKIREGAKKKRIIADHKPTSLSLHFEPNIASIFQKFRPSIFVSLASENFLYPEKKSEL